MTGFRKQYTREFKLEAIQLVEKSGRSASQLERDLDIGRGSLWRWKREFVADGEDAFPGHGRLTPEQDRLRQLEPEIEVLRQERDILKTAIAIFSRPKP
jgi:transposase